MLGYHAPERAGVRRADRLAFVENGRAAVDQRRVDDVGMADHPADVGGGPPYFARFDAVEIFHRPFERDHVSAIVAHDALRPTGGARRVEYVERIGGGDRHAVVNRAGVNERVVAQARPVVVAAADQGRLGLRALQDQTGAGLVCRKRNRFVEQRLVADDAAGLDAATRRQDHFRLGVVDPGGEFARGKAAKHYRMNSADAGAGEHGDHRLRYHRHIENDAIALADAEIAQHGGEHLRFGHQPVVADGAFRSGERGIVDDRRLLAAPCGDVAIDRVKASVADATRKPATVNPGVRVEHGLRLFEPVDVGGGFRPETLRIALPARVDLVIAARTGVHDVPPTVTLK